MMLQINSITVGYGEIVVLRDVSLDVKEGELITVIGSNGAGKSTLIKCISGLLIPQKGSIIFHGSEISGLQPHIIVEKGIVQVPEGRLLFPYLTVKENLEIGAYLIKNKYEIARHLDSVYAMFPILKDREKQLAQTLSGGEQQMLAISRALMSNPKMIIFDEPSLGLAPILVSKILDIILQINKELRLSVLLVEQNVRRSCLISDRAFLMENGNIVLESKGKDMLKNDHVRKAYLGL